MQDKLRQKLFYAVVIINYIMVTAYEFLTPTMSDDVIYADKVAEAGSFFGLFAQEYEHYMYHTGRSIAHIILRIFLYIGEKGVFNVVAGAVFVLLSLLIYANVSRKKKYDLRVYLSILMMLWLFEPTISNAVFWETGACNYMFTATIIFGFVTIYRKAFIEDRDNTVPFMILTFVTGLLAGWCNENSSGGVVFMSMVLLFMKWLEKKNFSGFKPWMITGFVGNVAGFLILLLSPGNFSRAESTEEAHTGLLALAARFLKITLNIKDYYLIHVFAFIVIIIAAAYRTGKLSEFWKATRHMLLFGLLFFVTCYALIAVPDSQLRTYYCASLFLMTGIAEGFSWVVNEGFSEDLVQIVATSLVTLISIFFVFNYIEEGANLARIKREFDEREAYYIECVQNEEMVIEAPMLRPNWQTRYSMAYESDICEDKFNWLNISYAQHYNLWYIIGVDRETWTKY